MKKFYLFFILPLFVVSCSKTPQADFYFDVDKAKVGSEVFFYNTSDNADTYEWNFGDGSFSTSKNPVHIYKTVGVYEITLTAFSRGGRESQSKRFLTVIEPTLLVVEVLEYYEEYPVGNASVVLYPTLKDWENETNAIVEGFTDDGGIVVFGNLNPIVHFVDVWEQYHNNWQLADEDIGFITTHKIVPDRVQWFTAFVDYVPNARGGKTMVIKKLEKRNPTGKAYPEALDRETDYETLLKKSVFAK